MDILKKEQRIAEMIEMMKNIRSCWTRHDEEETKVVIKVKSVLLEYQKRDSGARRPRDAGKTATEFDALLPANRAFKGEM